MPSTQPSTHQPSSTLTDSNKLQNVVLPTYYFAPKRFVDVMRHTIAFNAPYFYTHRMVREYMLHAYLP